MFKKILLIHGLLGLLQGIDSKCGSIEIQCVQKTVFDEGCSSLNYSLESNKKSDYNVDFWHDNSCQYDTYVHYLAKVNEHKCRNITSVGEIKSKTSTYLDRVKSNIENCSQIKVSYCLMYLLDGCYLFEIQPSGCLKKSCEKSVYRPVWISNENFDSTYFNITTPKFIYESDSGTNLTVKWMFDNKTHFDNDPEYILSTSDGVDYDCRWFSGYWYTLSCTLTNLNAGDHDISLSIDDDWRCKMFRLQNCEWHNKITKRKPIETEPPVIFVSASISPLLSGIIIGLGCIVLVIAASLGFIYVRKRLFRIKMIKSYDRHVCDVECRINDKNIKGILLLYARDCDAFMQAMNEFRTLLENSTGCKVYDLYDKAQFNEIAESSDSWIQNLIHDPNIKILIPATQCADVLYKNLLRLCTHPDENESPPCHVQFYKEANFLDTLYIYALKTISFDVTQVPYHKFYIVRFTHMDTCDTYLSHINPYKRFKMPKKLQVLCDSIMGYHPAVKNDDGVYDQLRSVELADCTAFNEALESLQKFLKDNRSYLLNDLLNSEIIVCNEELC